MPNYQRISKRSQVGAAAALTFATGMAEFHSVSPPWAQPWLHAGCWVFGSVAAAAGATWVVSQWLAKRPQRVCEGEAATDDELDELRKLAIEFFGDKVTSLERMRDWYKQNDGIFHTIKFVYQDKDRHIRKDVLDGYYCVVPLTSRAASAIRSKRLTVNDLDAADIAQSPEKTAALYIGAIAARTAIGAGVALNNMRATLNKLSGGRTDMPLIARPVTWDGVRLVRHFGLEADPHDREGLAIGKLHFGPFRRKKK